MSDLPVIESWAIGSSTATTDVPSNSPSRGFDVDLREHAEALFFELGSQTCLSFHRRQ